MLSKFNKNSIITGPLDAYCLICETYLRDQDEISVHIAKPIHTKNLDIVPYFEKYKEDHIRKVKAGYYCEYCNKLFATPAKVGIHVAESEHNQNKGLQLFKRTPNGVTAFGNILISNAAWNGVVDGTCTLCNTEFDNENIHKTSQCHVLNMIKTNIEFQNNNIYRKIDKETFHCLTCNEVLAQKFFLYHFDNSDHKSKIKNYTSDAAKASKPESFKGNGDLKAHLASLSNSKNDIMKESKKYSQTAAKLAKTPKEFDAVLIDSMKSKDYIKTNDRNDHGNEGSLYCMLCEWVLDPVEISRHLRSEHHLTMLKMHQDSLEEMSKGEESPSKERPNGEIKSCENDSNMNKVLESLPEFQKNDINIDLVSGTAICKKCSMHLGIDHVAIKTHIEEHKAKANKKETRQNLFQYSQKGTDTGKNTTLYSKPVFLKRNESNEASTSRRSSLSSKSDEEIEAFAAENSLSYNNRRVYCNLCKTSLPTSIKNLNEHINGPNHKFRMAASSTDNKVKMRPVKKVQIREFVTSFVEVENMFFQDVVINEKICLDIKSFLLVVKCNVHMWECFACNLNVSSEQFEDHCKLESHRKSMTDRLDCPIVDMDTEFIREVRTNVYHCGFCNSVETGWDNMEVHLGSVQHKERKDVSNWRLRQHLPDIWKHTLRQRMEIMAFMRMMASNDDNSSDSECDWY